MAAAFAPDPSSNYEKRSSSRRLTEDEWDLLVRKIDEGVCTPFLGAGVNHGVLPGGKEIALSWAKEHGYPLDDSENLASVAQYLMLTKPERPFPKDLIARLLRIPALPVFPPTHTLAFLADLKLPVYLTTNYDDYMFHALRQKHIQARVEMCAWNSQLRNRSAVLYEEISSGSPATARAHVTGFGPSVFSSRGFVPTSSSPVIYHMHGHQSSVPSMVLTENDYLDFLVNMSANPKLLPAHIQGALTGSSLLFIGYSLSDYNFRVLYRGLIHPLAENQKLSVSIQLPREDEKAVRYLDRYFEDFRIKVYWGTADEFVTELRDRLLRYNTQKAAEMTHATH